MEERERKHDREKRERERDKERFCNQPKRFRCGAANCGDFASTLNDYGGYQSYGRGGYGVRGRGGGARGKRPGPANKCHLCGSPDHFLRLVPRKSKQ